MARTIHDRLDRLTNRRDPEAVIALSENRVESFQKRSSNKATQYALGIMQAVDQRYTQISHEEAERVERNVTAGLAETNDTATCRMQGSVPLDVHIRGRSDVDLLVILDTYLRRERCDYSRKSYAPYDGAGSLQLDILALRRKCEEKLARVFWAAKVDTSPAKSIKLTGGAFRRDVDVVPSCWYDTAYYQQILDDKHRGIEVLDKNSFELISNFPFLYIAKIDECNTFTMGGTKMAIRLLKNMKSDSEADISLNSYDLGSLIYHCPRDYIRAFPGNDLQILAGVDRWLTELCGNYIGAVALETPDGTRKIIDSTQKWTDLGVLTAEVSALAREVEREVNGRSIYDSPDRRIILENLRNIYIPTAA